MRQLNLQIAQYPQKHKHEPKNVPWLLNMKVLFHLAMSTDIKHSNNVPEMILRGCLSEKVVERQVKSFQVGLDLSQ